jgi:hypothetical protein
MFDSGALVTLREEVRECAIQSGISEDRAEDMVLVIHELAANAVVHDGGESASCLRPCLRTGPLTAAGGDVSGCSRAECGVSLT